eukprot:4800918-Prorocentrum_lima.AAC.1
MIPLSNAWPSPSKQSCSDSPRSLSYAAIPSARARSSVVGGRIPWEGPSVRSQSAKGAAVRSGSWAAALLFTWVQA